MRLGKAEPPWGARIQGNDPCIMYHGLGKGKGFGCVGYRDTRVNQALGHGYGNSNSYGNSNNNSNNNNYYSKPRANGKF